MQHAFIITLTIAAAILDGERTYGQVTVLPTDVYQVGDHYRLGVQVLPSVEPGSAGAGQFWDLSGMVADWDYAMETVLAIDAPLGQPIPGTVAAVSGLDQSAYHFTVDASGLYQHGSVWDDEGVVRSTHLEPARTLLQFPASYGQQHNGESFSVLEFEVGADIGYGFVVDSVRRRAHYAHSYVIDGWGEVVTPFGTFNALRQNMIFGIDDTIDVKPQGSTAWIEAIEVQSNVVREFTYWSPQHGMPIARLIDNDDSGFIMECVWIAEQLMTTGVGDGPGGPWVSVMPNPVVDLATVLVPGASGGTYQLFDAHGRLAQEGRLTGERSEIPMNLLDPGMYMLMVRVQDRTEKHRIVKN